MTCRLRFLVITTVVPLLAVGAACGDSKLGLYEDCTADSECESGVCPEALGHCAEVCDLAAEEPCAEGGRCSVVVADPGGGSGYCTRDDLLPAIPPGPCLNYTGECVDTSQCCDPGPAGAVLSCVQLPTGNANCVRSCNQESDCPVDSDFNCHCVPIPEGATPLGMLNGTGICSGGIDCETDGDCCGDAICMRTRPGGPGVCEVPCTGTCASSIECCTGVAVRFEDNTDVMYCETCAGGGTDSGM